MGISGLLPFLESSSRKCYINEFRGCTVAIDSYCWLHKGAFSCAEKLISGEDTKAHIIYCLKFIQLLESYNIKPILVFDGQHLPAKKDTETKRREQRHLARAKGTEMLRMGKIDEARQYFRQCVDITHAMALSLIKECRKKNIDCIVAPYEADSQLAFLNMQGIADIVITEDSDLILFGCTKILFKFNLNGSAVLIERNNLNASMKMRPDQYSFEKFKFMCIMSGCDYLDSLPGIGLKRAHKAISMTHDSNIYTLLRRLPHYLNLKKLIVTDEYIENFKLADATVMHQIVYDPLKKKLTYLTDPEEFNTDPKYLKNAGEIGNSEMAFQMALGNIDPISKKVLDNWNPSEAVINTNSIWSKSYKKLKIQKDPNVNPLSNIKSTRNMVATATTEFTLSKREHEINEYNERLKEEMKLYQCITIPSLKRKEVDEDDETKTKTSSVDTCNPFVKNKITKLSKFQITTLNSDKQITSKFFTTKFKQIPEIYKIIEDVKNEECIQDIEKVKCSFIDTSLNKINLNEHDDSSDNGDNGHGDFSPLLSPECVLSNTNLNSKYTNSQNITSERENDLENLTSMTTCSLQNFDSNKGFLDNTQFIQVVITVVFYFL
ncbi:hypothetical protein FQA39_LY12281 [Lamprigera yunnana]|nr:hypothetical protein FQA39_LY12281 [Lamprigera yunnana]